MKEIIQEVLQAEENVGERLKQARAQGAQLLAEAETEASERIKQAKEEARALMNTLVEQARTEAEHYKEERLQQTAESDEALMAGDSETLETLVESICALIVSTEYDKDPP